MRHRDIKVRRRWVCLGLLAAGVSAGAAEKPWVEVRSPNFVVVSNAGEKQARRAADAFEQIRAVFQKGLKVRVDPGKPFVILAVRDEKSLRELLPEFWEVKGRMRPAGVFQGGEEKLYVALRLDAQGENPYHAVYHEYVHMLMNLNFRGIPLWLNEGLAEFYGNTVIGEKEVGIGRPSESALLRLNESKFLPLRDLFAADHRSPHYNEADKASIFYAESWALTHYLMLGEKGEKKRLAEFAALVLSDVPEEAALQRAFGDLKVLEKALHDYVRQTSFLYARMKKPADVQEESFPVRDLPAAETAAVRGDFLLRTKRPREAQALLEEALRLDPNLSAAHENLGFLHYREGRRQDAAKFFDQAVKLDSRSYLAHYYHAMLKLRFDEESSPEELENSLKRAIDLNHNFAAGYATLAGFYLRRDKNLEMALGLARRAAQLEPGNATFQLNVGGILLRMGRVEEAQKLGEQLLARAKSEEGRAAAESFLENVRRYEQYLAQKKAYEQRTAAAAAERKRFEEEYAAAVQRERARQAGGPQAPPRPESSAAEEGRPTLKRRDGAGGPRASAEGVIASVACKAPSAIDLVLRTAGPLFKLRSDDFRRVHYSSSAKPLPENFDACVHLKGQPARVIFIVQQGADHFGEIISIELTKR